MSGLLTDGTHGAIDLAHRTILYLSVLLTLFAFEPLRAQPTTAPAPAPAQREVSIETGMAGVRLSGTMSLPPGPGPHPAALLLTGEGGHMRDQVISGSPM